MEHRQVRRILAVKPSSLGDVLHTFPAIELLHRHYPEAELDWLIHPAFADVLDFSPFPVSRKIFFRRKELGRLQSFLPECRVLIRELRRERYDLIIDFQGLFRSSIFAFAARGSLPVGFASPREKISAIFYGKRFAVDMELHAVERNVALVNMLLNRRDDVPVIELPAGKYAPSLPELDGDILAGVMPGARWETKCFPPEFFAEVINRVHKALPQVKFAVVGTGAEKDCADVIVKKTGTWCFSMAGKTSAGEMMELLRRCRAVLSNDSGPVHAAAALNIPVFALFGPTRPELTGPYGASNRIYQLDIPCIKCMSRVCGNDEKLSCHRIDPEIVAQDMIQELKGNCK